MTDSGTAQPTRSEVAFEESGGGLAEVLDTRCLVEMQQSFIHLTGLQMSMLDAEGKPLTNPNSDDATVPLPNPQVEVSGRIVAPIVVEGRRLGSIAVEGAVEQDPDVARREFRRAAKQAGLEADEIAQLEVSAERLSGPRRDSVVAFLALWANSIARLCYQGTQLRHRVDELSTLYELSTLLSGHRALQQVLDIAVRSAAEVMQVKAASIRLLHDGDRELVAKAVHNLSPAYLNKGPIVVEQSELYRRTLAGEVVYVADMATDPRVLYPDDARREGLVSILGAPMTYGTRPIGVIRLYTGRRRTFTQNEIDMLRAVAQLLATAIENASLHDEHVETERIQRQLHLAGDVQRRMMPAASPHFPPLDIAARYVPSFELGGDFYDFIYLEGHLGMAVGDVVGKGVPASLLMASLRASLRAYAQDVYDLDEVIARVNVALTRDTLDNEFATLFYAVIDPTTLRMTYCNAGHEPPLLLRDGRAQRLEAGGMIVGVDAEQVYEKGLIELESGDLLLVFSDGLMDAQNFNCERFGRQRIIEAMHDVASADARTALNHILWEMRRFVGLNRLVDDTTLLVLKVTPRLGPEDV